MTKRKQTDNFTPTTPTSAPVSGKQAKTSAVPADIPSELAAVRRLIESPESNAADATTSMMQLMLVIIEQQQQLLQQQQQMLDQQQAAITAIESKQSPTSKEWRRSSRAEGACTSYRYLRTSGGHRQTSRAFFDR